MMTASMPGIVQQPAMIVVGGRARDQVARVIQPLVVHIGKSGDLNVRAGQRLMQQFRRRVARRQ